jgi:hypothetical protein
MKRQKVIFCKYLFTLYLPYIAISAIYKKYLFAKRLPYIAITVDRRAKAI